ncbi:MAG: transposase [Acutalibacteraceae bacterium]|nr:transposase [Acutalibacteraceae bacterium]
MELPKRKDLRMKEYDYSENGHYFVTVCTAERKETLSSIMVGEGLAPPEVKLTSLGKIAEEQIGALNERYGNVTVENYVIMPDHIHLLLFIDGFDAGGASPSPTLSDIICSFKSLTARLYKKLHTADKIWQRSFYDHVIRNEKDYHKHFNYIEDNPVSWILNKHTV